VEGLALPEVRDTDVLGARGEVGTLGIPRIDSLSATRSLPEAVGEGAVGFAREALEAPADHEAIEAAEDESPCEQEHRERYPPDHPWYYLAWGNNQPPVPVDDIPAAQSDGEFITRKLPKNPVKRNAYLRERLVEERRRFEEDKQRYADIVQRERKP
jgi:hypothetical protein